MLKLIANRPTNTFFPYIEIDRVSIKKVSLSYEVNYPKTYNSGNVSYVYYELDQNSYFLYIAGFKKTSEINTKINEIYYNSLTIDQINKDLTNSSYNYSYMTRWERLEYIKYQFLKENDVSYYDGNKTRYYGEFSFHMYGYYLLPWVKSLKSADVSLYGFDSEHGNLSGVINVLSIIFGWLGF